MSREQEEKNTGPAGEPGIGAVRPRRVAAPMDGAWASSGSRISLLRRCGRARQVGVVGQVRNLADGRVEIEVAGAPEKVRQLEEWVRRGGPPGAVVAEVRVEPLDGDTGQEWERFEIDR